MSFLIENYLLVLMALASGGLLLWHTMQKNQAGSIGTAEAVRLINHEKAVLIDVGEASEFATGHAPGARNVPLGELGASKALPANKALPVVVMCPSGARANRAVGVLRKAGFEKAIAVNGGLGAWREAGLPVEKAS